MNDASDEPRRAPWLEFAILAAMNLIAVFIAFDTYQPSDGAMILPPIAIPGFVLAVVGLVLARRRSGVRDPSRPVGALMTIGLVATVFVTALGFVQAVAW